MKPVKSFCEETAGAFVPRINLSNCGGKKECITTCPYDVLELRPITTEDRQHLNIKGHIKTFFKPHKAYISNPDLCFACGLCAQVCPERAIKLSPATRN